MKKVIFFILLFLSILNLFSKPKKNSTDNLLLFDTKWILVEIHDSSVEHQSDKAFIIFTDNYKFSGNFGCNIFFGGYIYGRKRIKMDYQGATKKYCEDMSLEEQFFKALKSDINRYYIENEHLYLLYKNKVICKFKGNNKS